MDPELEPQDEEPQDDNTQEPASLEELQAQLDALQNEREQWRSHSEQLERTNRTYQTIFERSQGGGTPEPKEDPNEIFKSLAEDPSPENYRRALASAAEPMVREMLSPILRAYEAAAELGEAQTAAGKYLQEHPDVQERYQKMVQVEPSLAADWLRMKLASNAPASSSDAELENQEDIVMAGQKKARAQAKVITSKPGKRSSADSEALQQKRLEDLAEAARTSRNYIPYLKERLGTSIEVWEPGQYKPRKTE